MKLLIVESPSKAKTINKYLGKEYTVVASVGHVRDLPKSNKNAIDIDGGFIPRYEVSPGKEKVVSSIKALGKKADEIFLATDPDREGEAIAWHVREACGLKKTKRVLFYEITKNAIKAALTEPRELDEDLRKAQEARRILDRLVGYDLSGLIWKKVRYGLSAGRVQSPALHILVEREQEIRAFNPVTFFVLSADFKTGKKEPLTLTASEEPKTKERADTILREAKEGTWTVTDLRETEAKRSPRPPFTTSTLQQAASSRLGMAPSRTMRAAQKLYEAGHITYMRTDSVHLGNEAKSEILSVIEKTFGKDHVQPREFKTTSKNAQEAHEAIRPTHFDTVPKLAGEEAKLYKLIRERAVASQMADARLMKTKIVANTGAKDFPDFSVTGSLLLFPGWLALDTDSRGEEIEVPKVTIGDPLTLKDIASEEKQTEPPRRYSEAGLVKELEKRGIGRPSTYASIIKTLFDREYVTKDGRSLQPTEIAEIVDGFLFEHFADVVSEKLTAEMEDQLDDIAAGKREYGKTLADFYTPFAKTVKEKDLTTGKATHFGDAPEDMKCPKCGGAMHVKFGKSGKFFSCAKYPDCDGALKSDGNAIEPPKETGEKCPKCDGPLVEREGRFGLFTSCGNYPKCKYIKKDAGTQNSTGVKCPICKEGEMTEKKGRFGFFYACSNYPKCKHTIKAKPTGALCEKCGALMMEGTKTIPDRCSNKLCQNHNPHKLNK